MTSGIFAIIGVALGSVLTYLVQTRIAQRAEHFARDESLRRERMDVYSAFAAGMMDARRSQINRWYQRRDAGRDSPQYAVAKGDSYQSRATARRERYRVELVANDADMCAVAQEAVESMGPIHKAQSKSDMERVADDTRQLDERFVTMASAKLTEQSGHS